MRLTSTPNFSKASTASTNPQSIPSTIAREISAGLELFRFNPLNTPVAFGRFGVRSPSKYGSSDKPFAPGFAESASAPTSSWDFPRIRVAASNIRAAFSVQTNGKNRPVASAKPATAPDES